VYFQEEERKNPITYDDITQGNKDLGQSSIGCNASSHAKDVDAFHEQLLLYNKKIESRVLFCLAFK